ncbi:D-aminoacyl-tRNA deacylase [Actinospongicola halichondriae]|uniref:D-aminoacyl-tRNA deacylase n=1 Tax=Actinospongicola halichondriae TaxID=3236844 RepID=UPI003D379236
MRAVVQRVSSASVSVDGEVVGQIGAGLLVLVGVTHDDGPDQAVRLAAKLAKLRLLDDADGVMNESVLDQAAEVLVVSQFTLYGDTRKGNRPSWLAAARPEHAEPLVDRLVEELRGMELTVETGRFRTDMSVSLVNNGPATVIVDS